MVTHITELVPGNHVTFTYSRKGETRTGIVETVRENRSGVRVLTLRDDAHEGSFRSFQEWHVTDLAILTL